MAELTLVFKDTNWAKFFNIVILSGVWAALSDKAKAVYPVLHCHASGNTRDCWPGNNLISREAGIHPKSVPAATTELMAKGLVVKQRQGRKNVYHLLTEQEILKVLPSRSCPSSIIRKDCKKRRNQLGRFYSPSRIDGLSPTDVALALPSQMDSNKTLRTKIKEQGKYNKNGLSSASASAGASASPTHKSIKELFDEVLASTPTITTGS